MSDEYITMVDGDGYVYKVLLAERTVNAAMRLKLLPFDTEDWDLLDAFDRRER